MSETRFQFELLRSVSGDDGWELDENHPALLGDAFDARAKLHDSRVEIRWEGSCIAIAEARWVVLAWADSSGSGDHDHYVALRLIERRDHPIWRELPWRDLLALRVFYAWNHYFFGLSRPREEGEEASKTSVWKQLEAAWESRELFTWHG